MRRRTHQSGFSLVELTVSVGLFAVVMVIAIGALLSLVDANRKARSLELVMNNLNIALDGMVRALRQGTDYACNSTAVPNQAVGANCPFGGTLISFVPFGANQGVQNQRWVYTFTNGKIMKSEDGGANYVEITAPEVTINEMTIYVVGTARGDTVQPKAVMVVKGTTGSNVKTQSSFYIQSTAVQRVLDI